MHYAADGTVRCKGTWWASDMGMGTHTGIPMTVTSTAVTPAGTTYHEGTTVGELTEPTSGTVAIRATG